MYRILVVCGLLAVSASVASAQGQRAVQLGPAAEIPRTLRAAAPIDLTGTWVSVVTEDWRWRMMTPPRYDYAAVPLNSRGREVADDWDPVADEQAGLQCKWYGAASIARVPGRVRISWANDNDLQLEFDAGTQTRHLRWSPPGEGGAHAAASSEKTWQGVSTATWEFDTTSMPRVRAAGGGGRGGGGGPRVRNGSLKVVTTGMKAGYLRRNGVPYSEHAVMTEYVSLFTPPTGDQWLIVTTIVEDPEYLNEPFVTSTHFKKEPNDAKFAPSPCVANK
jgi:hypothetical protein